MYLVIPFVGGVFSNYVSGLQNMSISEGSWAIYKQSRIDNLGVCYKSGSADYAEYLERRFLDEKLKPGYVVGIKNGQVSKYTDDASEILVISRNPAVLGNMPKSNEVDQYEKVAFMGQVPVFVKGVVQSGDFILASGQNDGLGIAVSIENLKQSDFKNIVGVAWSDAQVINEENIGVVNLSIGVGNKEISILAEIQKKELDDLKHRIALIEKKIGLVVDSNLHICEAPKTTTEKSISVEEYPDYITDEVESMVRQNLISYLKENQYSTINQKLLVMFENDNEWDSVFSKVKEIYESDKSSIINANKNHF